MINSRQVFMLFAVILIEGYVVLSTELLAIRQTITYTGSGTDTVAIIIAAVLMPLAFGYQHGGRFRPHRKRGKLVSVRKKLILNLVLAALVLVPGMSWIFMEYFFKTLLPDMGITHRLFQISVYSAIFLAIPVYLLGQTIPLVSNYFSKNRLSSITGRILFFSTVGSFMGAVFSTIVLMPHIGVHHTVTLNFILLSSLVVMLIKRKTSEPVWVMLGLTIIALFLNSNSVMSDMGIVHNNQYNTAQVLNLGNERHLLLNGNWSSMYNTYGRKHAYIEFAEKVAIDPIRESATPKEILIIGAGAFTLGYEDTTNHYTYIDLDHDLLETAEKFILKGKIKENKTFLVEEARAFLARSIREKKTYDFIYLDAYLGGMSIPEHLVTREFFQQIKDCLPEGGVFISNFIASPNFSNSLSRNLDSTVRSVMPYVNRAVIYDQYYVYDNDPDMMVNVAYIYRKNRDDEKKRTVYTDDKNTLFFDKPQQIPRSEF
ncbi:MAG: fused MFS/spermidine synthase [Alphaproteobacteria bacterium]|nr:fused MFS/spermidine synthase [Alphaproteobacteria bacterium]MCB9975011.1 fused MFS/spermidine synthase [Rhodospirillales bacterium]